jgi:hypothetical protein
MKKVYLIGDCHASRILEHWNPETCPVDFKVWGKAGNKAFHFDPVKLFEENEDSSGVEDHNLYIHYERLSLPYQDIKDDGLILAWLGYVDIRQYLSKYDNADQIVKLYMNSIINFYPNSEIRFIEPLPQFTEMLLKFEGISPSYTYSQRLEQNFKFIQALNKYSLEYGLQKPISQSQIKKAVGLDEFTTEHTIKDRPHPQDALEKIYMSKIYDLFISECVD